MAKTSLASNIYHVDASLHVESNVLVCKMEPAVKNTVGMLGLTLIWLTAEAKKCIEPVLRCFLLKKKKK